MSGFHSSANTLSADCQSLQCAEEFRLSHNKTPGFVGKYQIFWCIKKDSRCENKDCQMASSPASVFSSPSRRPSAGSTRPKPKLCRRWSMDNINCKEGYVKDLRKQHQAQQVGQRDEAYPFMMSESRRRGRISSLGTTPTICETRPSNNTRPLSCSPPHHSKNLFFLMYTVAYL